MVFCTLFDSFYIDKGLALHKSLCKVSNDFKLYIFCFDDISFHTLNAMSLSNVIIIHHSDIENEQLLKLKQSRSKAEYCWTCTPVIIEHVLSQYHEANCTYIDADLYFFSDPAILFEEIEKQNADAVITEHRFPNSISGQRHLKRSGKYCVEFNYFCNTENSKKILGWWKEKCLEWCFHIYEENRMGDQKYLEQFPILFNNVYELQHLGGGVAPWNLSQYKLVSANEFGIYLEEKSTKNAFPLIFYHFQNLKYITENIVNASSGTHSKRLKDAIYVPYLKELVSVRKELLKYGISFDVHKVYSSNPFIAFMQKTILRYKILSITDLYTLTKL